MAAEVAKLERHEAKCAANPSENSCELGIDEFMHRSHEKNIVNSTLIDVEHFLKRMVDNRGYCDTGLQQILREKQVSHSCFKRPRMESLTKSLEYLKCHNNGC